MVEVECVKGKLRTSWAAPHDPSRELLLRPTADSFFGASELYGLASRVVSVGRDGG
jgi:hypothetical protein